MKKLRDIFLLLLIALVSLPVAAQRTYTITGTVVDPYDGSPIEGAVVSATNLGQSVTTDANGTFKAELSSLKGELNVWYPGYYTKVIPVNGRTSFSVILIPENKYGYTDYVLTPNTVTPGQDKNTNTYSRQSKDFTASTVDVEKTFTNIPGLYVAEKSGMPGEGSFFQIRGNRTANADGMPLIVLNGQPYFGSTDISGVVNGYSTSLFSALNAQDIASVSVLKGADAAKYGSLAANGVIAIETERAIDLDTRVEFIGQYGVDLNQSKLPTLSVKDYKNYVSMLGLTDGNYEDMDDLLVDFPYLSQDPSVYVNPYLYTNNTDWQDEIYSPGFVTDNTLKIKGGDAIAKYDLSIGYKRKEGQVKNTDYNRYYARLNSDINLSRNLVFTSSLSLAYINSNLQEQGLSLETNPLLAALRKAPLLSPYAIDDDGKVLPEYAPVRNDTGLVVTNNAVSNPLSLVDNVRAKNTIYDVQALFGLNGKIKEHWTLGVTAGLYYYKKNESVFIPGVTEQSIMPLQNGLAENTSRDGETELRNFYFAARAGYDQTFSGMHNLKGSIGVQSAINSSEYDYAQGINSANDYYYLLGNTSSNVGRVVSGYMDKFNWVNINANVNYTYNHLVGVGVTLASDYASSFGNDAPAMAVFPSVNAAFYAKNAPGVRDVDFINQLTLRAEYVTTGNSRFSSSLSKYAYSQSSFRALSGLVRAGIANTDLKWETDRTFDVGVDFSMWNNRIDASIDYYNGNTSDVIMLRGISSVFGTSSMYDNIGTLKNEGVEVGFQFAPVYTKNFQWYIGATLAHNKNRLTSLDGNANIITEMSDGSAIISEVGQPLYSFYGYETAGVFATDEEAAAANLKTPAGVAFGAGDMHFVDQDGNGIIDEKDRVNLGSADPNIYGSIYTTLRYKNFELSVNFGYSQGNKAYNAVRRIGESMSDYGNQLSSTNRRWQSNGDVTSIPKATYGDPMENNRFSDRWIEDASYLKLKEIYVSYKFNFLRGTTIFASAENVCTFTKYLGLDPETYYSYDSSMRGFDYGKISLPRSFKVGVKLEF